MIVKQREIPLVILKLEALLRRLPPHHPKMPLIKEEISKRKAGFKGETSLDFPLGFLNDKRYYILHDLRLSDANRYFQMDTLILSLKFALILEVKNISGILHFDTIYNQLFRNKDGEESVFPCPIVQVNRQENQLKKWFAENGFGQLPIFSKVVITNPHTGIKSIPPNVNLSQKVIHKEVLPSKIIQIETNISENQISEKQLKKSIRLLKKASVRSGSSISDRFQINKEDVATGVFCPDCNLLPMIRVKRTWHCKACRRNYKEAHINAIKDYSLIFGTSITNRELRSFLQIESITVATRILNSMELPHTGGYKNRKYELISIDNKNKGF